MKVLDGIAREYIWLKRTKVTFIPLWDANEHVLEAKGDTDARPWLLFHDSRGDRSLVARPDVEDRSGDREALFVPDELGSTGRRTTPADLRMEERDANEARSVCGNVRWWRMTCEELNGKGRRRLQVFTEAYRVFAEG